MKKNGFTLLEALIAMMIMASALLLLANSWSAAFSRVKKTQLNFELSTLLERKIGDIEREYRDKPISEIKDEDGGPIGDEFPQYSWTMKSKKFEMPDIAAAMVGQDGGVDPKIQMVVKQMTEHISKAVKEVTVTITYKAEKRSLEATVTTYFVDFDRSFVPTVGAP